MANCEQIREYMSAMLDNEASEHEREAVFTHIETCDECRAFFELITEINDNMTAEVEVPEGFTQQVMDAVRQQSKKKRFPYIKRYLAAAACVVIVGAVTLGTLRGRLNMKSTDSAAVADMNMAPQYMLANETAAAADAGENDMELPAEYAPDADIVAEEEAAPAEAKPTPMPPDPERADEKNGYAADSSQDEMHASESLTDIPQGYEDFSLILLKGDMPEMMDNIECSERDGKRIYEIDQERYEILLVQYECEVLNETDSGKYAVIIE